MKKFIVNNFISILIVIFIIVTIEIIVRLEYVSVFVFPAPSSIFSAWWAEKTTIIKHLFITSIEAVSGFILGSIIAIGLAIAFVRFKSLERAILPLAVVLQTLPIVVISPVLIILLGNGLSPKILIAALITFFPVLVNMTRGFREVEPDLIDLFTILDANWKQTFLKLRLPSSLSLLFPAMRIASANCFIGAIIGEWISADSGIGYWILIKMYQLKIDSMYAGVISGSLAALVLFLLVNLAEYTLLPWKRTTKNNNGGI